MVRGQITRTRARDRATVEKLQRACGVRKIRESGLPADHPISAIAITFINGMPSPGSTRTYGYSIGAWLSWCTRCGIDPGEATRLEARAYYAELRFLAPKTRVQNLAALRSFYEEVVDEGLALRNPFRRIFERNNAPVTPTPALTEDEFKRLLGKIRLEFGHPDRDMCARRDYAMVYLMGRIGLRRCEVSDLRWSDLRRWGDFVAANVHSKGNKYLDVKVPQDILDELRVWTDAMTLAVGDAPSPHSPVFPVLGRAREYDGARDLPLAPYTVGAIVRDRMVDAGFDGPRYGAHALRATAATIASENGADLLAIAAMLRHANVRTTQGYIKLVNSRRTSAADVWTGPNFAAA